MKNNVMISCDLGILNFLTILFVILKIKGTIDWSWWWVLGPTWIPVAISIVLIIPYIIIKLKENENFNSSRLSI